MGDLGKRLARGEVAAFAELYDLCADRLHHYLVSQLGSRDDADEVLQETFLRLVRGREKLAGVESIAGYCFMVARNEALRRLAARSNESRRRAEIAGAAWREQVFGRALEAKAITAKQPDGSTARATAQTDAAKADARTSWERYHQFLRDLAATTATFKL